MDNIFEKASRIGLRFTTPKGLLAVEDLWNLPLQSNTGKANLDDIAKSIHLSIKASGEVVSFVDPAIGRKTGTDELALEIVKRIIEVRVAERDAEATKQKRAAEKQKILSLIAEKQDEALRGKSLDDLQKMVNEL